jgi:hypothetical protein
LVHCGWRNQWRGIFPCIRTLSGLSFLAKRFSLGHTGGARTHGILRFSPQSCLLCTSHRANCLARHAAVCPRVFRCSALRLGCSSSPGRPHGLAIRRIESEVAMIRSLRSLRLPHLALLGSLALAAAPPAWTAKADARTRDAVQMGDPTDDQAPSPGPGGTKNSAAFGDNIYDSVRDPKIPKASRQTRFSRSTFLTFLKSLRIGMVTLLRI